MPKNNYTGLNATFKPFFNGNPVNRGRFVFDAGSALLSLDADSIHLIHEAIKNKNTKKFIRRNNLNFSRNNAFKDVDMGDLKDMIGSPINYLAILKGFVRMPNYNYGWEYDFHVSIHPIDFGDFLFDYGLRDINKLTDSNLELLRNRHQAAFPNVMTIDNTFDKIEENRFYKLEDVRHIMDNSEKIKLISDKKDIDRKTFWMYTPAGQFINISTISDPSGRCMAISLEQARIILQPFLRNGEINRFFGIKSPWLERTNWPSASIESEPKP